MLNTFPGIGCFVLFKTLGNDFGPLQISGGKSCLGVTFRGVAMSRKKVLIAVFFWGGGVALTPSPQLLN